MADFAAPLVLSIVYLALLAGFSEVVERVPRLARAARHPLSFGLALGVYATSWTFFGSVGFASQFGYAFLAVSLGVVLSCLAVPFIWEPLSRVIRRQRLTTLADLLAFRYQSQSIGTVVTLFLLAGLMPYVSLQLRSITESAAFLTPGAPSWLGIAYAAVLGIFAAGLGARYLDPRVQRPGLLATLASESLIKLLAITVVGAAALFGVFGGPAGLESYLTAHPDKLAGMMEPVGRGPWLALLLASFFAGFLLPRQFHVAFVEQPSTLALRRAAWVLPLFLLLLNLPLPILYWAGERIAAEGVSPDRYVLVATTSPALRLVAFLGGVSASSAMVLVTSIALSGMIVNNLVVPFRQARSISYPYLRRMRRVVILAVVTFGFVLHLLIPHVNTIVDLGLVSFAAVLQMVPGVLGTIFWPRATGRGFMWGLTGGVVAWGLFVVVPLLGLGDVSEQLELLGLGDLDMRSAAIFTSLGVNATLFVIGSLAAPPRAAEAAAAAACVDSRPQSLGAPAGSVAELEERLTATLGPELGEFEVRAALEQLGLDADEKRPMALRRLAEQVQRNVSQLVGPISALLPADASSEPAAGRHALLAAEAQYLAERARHSHTPAAGTLIHSFELVRRYLTSVLDELPIGVCAVDPTGRVAVWNHAMAELSRIPTEAALLNPPMALDEPWAELLSSVMTGFDDGPVERRLSVAGRYPRVVRLRRSALSVDGEAVLVEDLSQQRRLQAQVAHRDRLSSVGRLAAGLAHEIGNPLSGVLILARNLAEDVTDEDERERLGLLIQEAQRIESIIRSLLDFSRTRSPAERLDDRNEAVDVGSVVHDALRLVRLGRRDQQIAWEVAVDEGLHVAGDARRLAQVVVNLLANAYDASTDGDTVAVRAGERDGNVAIEIEDEGCGIPEDLADRVFEPFFTTKGPGEGSGLGLAVSYWIVREHGGSLDWQPRAGGGTTFRVVLPKRAGETRVEAEERLP